MELSASLGTLEGLPARLQELKNISRKYSQVCHNLILNAHFSLRLRWKICPIWWRFLKQWNRLGVTLNPKIFWKVIRCWFLTIWLLQFSPLVCSIQELEGVRDELMCEVHRENSLQDIQVFLFEAGLPPHDDNRHFQLTLAVLRIWTHFFGRKSPSLVLDWPVQLWPKMSSLWTVCVLSIEKNGEYLESWTVPWLKKMLVSLLHCSSGLTIYFMVTSKEDFGLTVLNEICYPDFLALYFYNFCFEPLLLTQDAVRSTFKLS